MEEELMNNKSIETTENSGQSATSVTEVMGVSLFMAIFMSFLAGIICVVFYHFTIAPKSAKKLAVIDVQAISSGLENEARRVLVENLNATDADREAAAKEFEKQMKDLQSIVTQVGSECDCTLLIKAALLNNSNNKTNGIMDYTAEVREKLGMANPVKAEAK